VRGWGCSSVCGTSGGTQPHDIQNINILNHYIGMKPIDPATVDVLTIMPWVVGFLMVAALAVARSGSGGWWRGGWSPSRSWARPGLMEFHSWNYDYGHNLDPTAPIKIPGMTYQPPMLGTKQLLNMSTSSYPSWGTLFVALAFGAGVLALVNEYARRLLFARLAQRRGRRTLRPLPAMPVGDRAGCASCSPRAAARSRARQAASGVGSSSPPTSADCAYCEGTIAESRLRRGALHHRRWRPFRFRGIECMAGFLLEERVRARPDRDRCRWSTSTTGSG
jgi:copper chaperone NosL